MNSEVKVICPRKFVDDRGYFSEVWNRKTLFEEGIDVQFVQDNISLSINALTIRGLHFQKPPFAQDKLIRCSRGRIFDVAVDIRIGSRTYGDWFADTLSEDNGKQMFIPKGFLHGFITLEQNTEVSYKCSEHFSPENEVSVRFDDRDIAIEWPVDASNVIISEKDRIAMPFKDLLSPFKFNE